MLTPLRNKMFDKLYAGHIIRPKSGGAATTLNSNVAIGATALTLTAAAGMDDTDPVLVGAAEDRELVVQTGAPAGQVITVVAPGLKRAHVSTEPVVEGAAFDLGTISATQLDESSSRRPSQTTRAGTPRARSSGAVLGPRIGVQGFSPHLFALLTGIPIRACSGGRSRPASATRMVTSSGSRTATSC